MFLTSNVFSLALNRGRGGWRGNVADLNACDEGGGVISWLFRGRVGGISGNAGGFAAVDTVSSGFLSASGKRLLCFCSLGARPAGFT